MRFLECIFSYFANYLVKYSIHSAKMHILMTILITSTTNYLDPAKY